MAECLEFAADGKDRADIELQPLLAINNIFERLGHGDMPSRVVFDFTAGGNEKTAAPAREATSA